MNYDDKRVEEIRENNIGTNITEVDVDFLLSRIDRQREEIEKLRECFKNSSQATEADTEEK